MPYVDPYGAGAGSGSGGAATYDPYYDPYYNPYDNVADFVDYSDLYDDDVFEDASTATRSTFPAVDPYQGADPYAPANTRDLYAPANPRDPHVTASNTYRFPGKEEADIESGHVVESVQRLQEALVIAAQEDDVGHLRQLINARGDSKDAHTVVMRQFALGLPLDVAAKMGNLGVVTQIVKFTEKSKMLLNKYQEELDRAIYLAARADERRVMRHLLGKGASLHFALEGAGDGGHDGLMEALYGRIRRAQDMEALGAQPTEEQLNMLAMSWQLLPTEEELEEQRNAPKSRRWFCVWLCKTTQSDKEIARRERRDYKAQTRNDLHVLEKMAEEAVGNGAEANAVMGEPTVTAQSFAFGSTGTLP